MLDQILTSASDAFLQVGVYVGALLLVFSYVNYKTTGRFVAAIARNRAWQPVIGALMGIVPGCGGSIFVMPLYVRGVVSFGTVCATLTATTGDSAWVMISRAPTSALWVNLITFAIGVVTGYVVDLLGLGRRAPGLSDDEVAAETEAAAERTSPPPCPAEEGEPGTLCPTRGHLGHRAGDEVERKLHSQSGMAHPGWQGTVIHRAYLVWWGVAVVGFVVSVLGLAQVDLNALLVPGFARGVGLAGALVCLTWFLLSQHFLGDDSHEEQEEKLSSVRELFVHNADETSFVVWWVFVAYLTYNVFMTVSGVDLQALVAAAGVWPVLVGVAVGLIPGCGPQVLLVTLYTQGVVPFSVVLANAVSQDGDALFPLIALEPRSAIKASVVTTVPALVVGLVAFYVEKGLL